MSGSAAASLGARVAALLCDLHSAGLAHNQLSPEHVLLGSDGSVRLCGFGASGPGGGAEDVRALGDLLDSLIDSGDRSAEAAAVRAVAMRGRAHEPSARPTASAVAASLASVTGATNVDASPSTPMARRRLGAAALLVTGLIGIVAAALLLPRIASAPTARVAAPTTSMTTVSTTTSTTEPAFAAERVWPPTTTTLVGNGSTWSFGGPDDRVVVGRWRCSDVVTPAMVRDDGTVWVVPAWPDGDVRADYVTTVDGDVRDVAVQRDGECDALVVTTSTSTLRVL